MKDHSLTHGFYNVFREENKSEHEIDKNAGEHQSWRNSKGEEMEDLQFKDSLNYMKHLNKRRKNVLKNDWLSHQYLKNRPNKK